jgi:hypothetical protein
MQHVKALGGWWAISRPLKNATHQAQLPANKGCDTADFIAPVPQAPSDSSRGDEHHRAARLAIDAPTTRHEGYLLSQRIRKQRIRRKRIEASLRLGKDARPMRKMKLVSKELVNFVTPRPVPELQR